MPVEAPTEAAVANLIESWFADERLGSSVEALVALVLFDPTLLLRLADTFGRFPDDRELAGALAIRLVAEAGGAPLNWRDDGYDETQQ